MLYLKKSIQNIIKKNKAIITLMTDNLFHEYTFGVKRVRFTYENENGTIVGT